MKIPVPRTPAWVFVSLCLFSATGAQAKPRCESMGDADVVTLARVHALIDTCHPKNVSDVLKRLPKKYFEHYALVYDSRSLQAATPENPRAIVLGFKGDLTLAFTDGFARPIDNQTIEFMQQDEDGSFEFEALSFDADSHSHLTGANPASCLSCHGQSPRPIFDPYFFWPGVYFSEDDEKSAAEEQLLAPFFATGRTRGPYVALAGHEPMVLNVVNDELGRQNAGDIRREVLGQKGLQPYRFALLGAMTCNDDISAFLPEGRRKDWPVAYPELLSETNVLAQRSLQQRLERHYRILKIDHATASRIRSAADDGRGTESHTDVTARMRYIVEGAGFEMKSWSTEFGSNLSPSDPRYSPNYSFDDRGYTFDRLQRLMWKDLVSSESASPAEREVYSAFARAANTDGRSPSDRLNLGDAQAKVCESLRSLSQQALSP